MPKHSTNPIMSDSQVNIKLAKVNDCITPEERWEDALVEVLSFLVSVRDHHKNALTIDDAIARIKGHQKKPVVIVREFLIARRDGEQCHRNVWDAIELIKGVLDK